MSVNDLLINAFNASLEAAPRRVGAIAGRLSGPRGLDATIEIMAQSLRVLLGWNDGRLPTAQQARLQADLTST